MITKEQIETAADEYSTEQWEVEEDFYCRDCMNIIAPPAFVAGAEWRINSAWHDTKEKPQKGEFVLFECNREYGITYTVSYGENYELMNNVIIRWAYVKDLIPELETR